MLEIDLTDIIPEYLDNKDGDLASIIKHEEDLEYVDTKHEFAEYFESHTKYDFFSEDEPNVYQHPKIHFMMQELKENH